LTSLLSISICLIAIQLAYWTFFYVALSREIHSGSAIHVPVSVIVCAHDEEENLRELLPLLKMQNHPEFEIIIVDDRSNDGTYDFLLEESRKDARVKMVHVRNKPEHVNGKKYALTLAIKSATYDWVLLTDADCRPQSTEWIRQMAGGFQEQTSLVLGYSPYQALPGLLNTFIRFETIITAIQYFSFALAGMPYMAVGRNLAYRKKLFLENKGFNGHISVTGGDDDLFVNQHANRGNVSVMLNERSLAYSMPKVTWRDYLHQKLRHLAVGKHYTRKSKFMIAPIGISWVLFWPSIVVTMFSTLWPLALVAVLRWILQVGTVVQFSKRSGEKFNALWVPFVDFIFCFYYLVTGFKALTTKTVAWKTKT
jgi:glycosyltransferase involved in cell wall biosynthesis